MDLNGNTTGWVLCAVHRLPRFHINNFFLSDQSWSVVCFECYKKVHICVQRWEPKPADKPVIPEKGRAVGAKKVDGHTNVQVTLFL